MTTPERDFDWIAAAWLADGPEELSDRVLDSVVDQIHLTRQRRAWRVPWRFPTMSLPLRLAAIVVAGILALAGVVVLTGGGFGTTRSVPSTPPVAAPAVTLPPLDTTFTSPWHGYSIKYPAGWTATAATQAWAPDTDTPWGDPALDEIKGSSLGSTHPSGDIRFVGTQQTFAAGETADAWLRAYCRQDAAADCSNVPASWPQMKVADLTAYIDLDGPPAAGGTILPGGRIYDVIVPAAARAYVFTLDGNVDRSVVDAFLQTVTLRPGDAVDTPPLTGRFDSPTHGYSIGTLPAWTITPSTKAWTDATNDSSAMDGIGDTGADGIGGTSQPLSGRSFDDFLAAFEASQESAGCGGGDPTTWQSIPIGDRTGVFYDDCGSAEALVQAGDRVYLFELGHGPTGAGQTFSVAEFKQLLTSVIFDPASAKD